jgi:predicted ferric reductase
LVVRLWEKTKSHPGTGISPGISCWEKEKAEGQRRSLSLSYSSENLSDHLEGKEC